MRFRHCTLVAMFAPVLACSEPSTTPSDVSGADAVSGTAADLAQPDTEPVEGGAVEAGNADGTPAPRFDASSTDAATTPADEATQPPDLTQETTPPPCTGNADCAAGQACDTTATPAACKPKVCEPGATACDGDLSVQTCDSLGLAWSATLCPYLTLCIDAKCVDVVCKPGSKSCVADQLLQCKAAGTGKELLDDCKAQGKVCVGLACIETKKCGDGKVNQPDEQCDDGNNADADGCSATCKLEPLCVPKCLQGLACIGMGECALPCKDGAPCTFPAAIGGQLPPGSKGLVAKDGGATMVVKTWTKTAALWISNSPQGSVSKIDTKAAKEIGRYQVCLDPSRTAVDYGGNAWIACRGDAKVAKIIGDKANCPDKNGNGTVDTSSGPEMVAGDECIAFVVEPDGGKTLARALAVGTDGHVWAGFSNSHNLRKLDVATGAVLDTVNIGCSPYGMAVDGKGILWVQGAGCGNLIRVDPKTKEVKKIPYKCGADGIAVDKFNSVWTAQAGLAGRYEPATGNQTCVQLGCKGGRGVTTDDAGFVYVACDESSAVAKIDAQATKLAQIFQYGKAGNGETPVGVAIDSDGYLWAVNLGSSSATKIDTKNGNVLAEVKGLVAPDTYGNMTSESLQPPGGTEATWRALFYASPGFGTLASWDTLAVNATLPPGSDLHVRVRAGADAAWLAKYAPWSPWLVFAKPPQIDLNPATFFLMGTVLEIEVKLGMAKYGPAPVLQSVQATW